MIWFFILSFTAWIGKPASGSCPRIEMIPPRVVLRFGGSLSVNCTSSSNQTEGMGWESPYGSVDLTMGVSSLPFKIDRVSVWVIDPMCYVNLNDGEQCTKTLPVTVYKMPDSVSLRQSLIEVVEGQHYSLQCDVVNVAPARNLSVLWHKGNKLLSSQTFDESPPSPVNKSSVLNLIAHRDDDGTEIWCEAKLNLWLEAQGPPTMRSMSHKVTVLYPPTLTNPANETLELSAGNDMTLNCTARGSPAPSYRWQFPQAAKDKSQAENQPILTRAFEHPGSYICTASNSQGTVTKYFTVNKPPSANVGVIVGIVIAVLCVLFILGGIYWIRQHQKG